MPGCLALGTLLIFFLRSICLTPFLERTTDHPLIIPVLPWLKPRCFLHKVQLLPLMQLLSLMQLLTFTLPPATTTLTKNTPLIAHKPLVLLPLLTVPHLTNWILLLIILMSSTTRRIPLSISTLTFSSKNTDQLIIVSQSHAPRHPSIVLPGILLLSPSLSPC